MKNKLKYYRTVIEIEVLSEDPIENASMDEISFQTTEGQWSGKWTTKNQDQEMNGKETANKLSEHGTDPEFFGIDENGNTID